MGTGGRRIAEFGYVAVVAGCAVLGALREDPRFNLAGIALTLPVGVVALLGIYGGYALLSAIGSIFADTQLPDGSTPVWLTTSSAFLNVVLITGAAFANVSVARWWLRRRSRPSVGR